MKWLQRKSYNKYKESDLIVEKLSAIRGVKNLNDWLNPPSKYVHSPYGLDNIDEAVQRIIKAIHTGQKIVIVADIDTDGVCSTGVMYGYLVLFTDNVTYVHAQRSDGHGVEKVLHLIEDDVDLVIIVDSSSNSVEACNTLKESGKDVIIIDHHEVDVENPSALIVNCQLGSYMNKDLSGSAMAYKVCQVLDEYLDVEFADNFLDLASIGLVGDMMNVRDMENRYIIYNGINKIDNMGIKEILNQSKIDFSDGITTTNISFKIAPIIGACSRFDKIELALELVTTDDEDRAKELTKQMIQMNEERKSNQKSLVEDVIKGVNSSNNLIMVFSDEIESGFRGLIATEVVSQFSKPVFVLKPFTEVDEDGNVNITKYSGSARSIGVIPLKSMCQDSGLFNFATGHEQAFGVEFVAENLDAVYNYFNEMLDEDDLQHVVEYDLEVNVDDIDDFDIKQLEKFSKIVGQGFPEPKFKIKGIIVEEGYSKKLGSHMRAVLGANKDTIKILTEEFTLMKFRTNDQYGLDVETHFNNDDNFITELEVVGSLNLNSYFNFQQRKLEITKQVFIEDYKIIE